MESSAAASYAALDDDGAHVQQRLRPAPTRLPPASVFNASLSPKPSSPTSPARLIARERTPSPQPKGPRMGASSPSLPGSRTQQHSAFEQPLLRPRSMSSSSSASSLSSSGTLQSPQTNTAAVSFLKSKNFARVVCALFVATIFVVVAFVANFVWRSSRTDRPPFCVSWVTTYHIVPDAVTNCPKEHLLQVQWPNQTLIYASDLPIEIVSSPVMPIMKFEGPDDDRATTASSDNLLVLAVQHFSSMLARIQSTFSKESMPARALNDGNERLYWLWVLDPDYPSIFNTTARSRVLACYADIPSSNPLDFSKARELYAWHPPTVGLGTGPHRIVFLLYETTGLSYTLPENQTLPLYGVNADALMTVFFRDDMTGAVVGGTFYTTVCRVFSRYCLLSEDNAVLPLPAPS